MAKQRPFVRGQAGGERRAEVLTSGERSALSSLAAKARWAGKTAEERKVERAKGRTTESGRTEATAA